MRCLRLRRVTLLRCRLPNPVDCAQARINPGDALEAAGVPEVRGVSDYWAAATSLRGGAWIGAPRVPGPGPSRGFRRGVVLARGRPCHNAVHFQPQRLKSYI